jgi:hypothetical protein
MYKYNFYAAIQISNNNWHKIHIKAKIIRREKNKLPKGLYL